jgi:hypothetical protein
MRAHKLNVTKADILKIIVEVAELELMKGSRKLLEKGKISKVIVTPHPPYKQEANNICNYVENSVTRLKWLIMQNCFIPIAKCFLLGWG